MVQSLTPELFVENVDDAVRHYTEALGFQLVTRVPESGGVAEYARVSSGAVSIMFEPTLTPQTNGVALYMDVPDADAVFADLKARGALIVEGPVDRSYGMREVVVEDNTGYKLVFMSPVRAGEPAKA